MPLYDGACAKIRANLDALRAGKKVSLVAIGKLTDVQLAAINEYRRGKGYPPIEAEVLFLGRHIYKSRMLGDGYSAEDVVDQIVSGMDAAAAIVKPSAMAAMENPNLREDRYNNLVRDRVVFECSARHPKPELFGVVPKGDYNKPAKMKKPSIEDERLLILAARPGNELRPAAPAAIDSMGPSPPVRQ